MVERHRRRNQFTQDDYDASVGVLGHEPDLILLPHVVAEASDLLAQIADPYKDALLRTLKAAVLAFRQDHVASRIAVSRSEFRRLRVTNCAIPGTADARLHLLTVDLDLYLAFLRAGRPVTTFRHVIDDRP